MPEELRSRLVAAAQKDGRSLNREIVSRLERSLSQDARPRTEGVFRSSEGGGTVSKHMSRRTALVLVLIAGLAAAVGAVIHSTAGGSPSAVRQFDPDAKSALKPGGNARATAAIEGAPSALQAAAEAYAERAFPADDVSLQLTLGAQSAWTKAKGRGHGKHSPAGTWTLAGPSYGTQPSILNFSGREYPTSGRVTALAIDPSCNQGHCTLWLAAAGGGVWRSDKALHNNPSWTYVGDGLPTNSIGTLTYDARTGTLYAGTGEPNAAVDNEAGLGLWKSTDGGDTWTHLPAVTTTSISGQYTGDAFLNRAINSVVVDPRNSNVLYVGSASAVRGISSVLSGGVVGAPVPLPGRGVYKSIDGGQTFQLLNTSLNAQDPAALPFPLRGVTNVALDPSNPDTIYAGQFGQGIYRSTTGGSSWTRIFAPINPANPAAIERDSFAVTALPNGKTRMYVGAGDNGTFQSQLFRSDDVATGAPAFTNITTPESVAWCGFGAAQCWYDNVVYSPAGHPDTIYLGGNYDYNNAGIPATGGDAGKRTNGRAFIVSNDGGRTWNDLTRDAGPEGNENGMHPDQHAIVVSPTNSNIVFFGSDGGIVRSSGSFADISGQCAGRSLSSSDLAICQQLLSAVPTHLDNLNRGLATLQFQSLSVNPSDPRGLQGGTQDNGTWVGTAGDQAWTQTIWGDGGQSGFNAANSTLRFNSFTGQLNDVNFRGGDPSKWVTVTGNITTSPEGAYFYAPVIADPNPSKSGSIFQGSQSVWRTQDWGGDRDFLEANCSEFSATAANDTKCGDFTRIGPAGNTSLTAASLGTRAGGNVAALRRAPSDTGTLWVATGAGRVFVSQNANDAATSVTFTRLDSLASNSPGRFVSGIYVDPTNPNHAWLSYSGFNANTPGFSGHVFSVTFTPAAGTAPASATWTSLDGSGTTAYPDIPATDVAVDTNGDVYVSNDFGVMLLPYGSTDWEVAGDGLPRVEVAGLTIVPGARKLYAATHGLSAWQLTLP